jgi:hypothetical protein
VPAPTACPAEPAAALLLLVLRPQNQQLSPVLLLPDQQHKLLLQRPQQRLRQDSGRWTPAACLLPEPIAPCQSACSLPPHIYAQNTSGLTDMNVASMRAAAAAAGTAT